VPVTQINAAAWRGDVAVLLAVAPYSAGLVTVDDVRRVVQVRSACDDIILASLPFAGLSVLLSGIAGGDLLNESATHTGWYDALAFAI
jgi:hypothetical protein